jgi:hypothetical protein
MRATAALSPPSFTYTKFAPPRQIERRGQISSYPLGPRKLKANLSIIKHQASSPFFGSPESIF